MRPAALAAVVVAALAAVGSAAAEPRSTDPNAPRQRHTAADMRLAGTLALRRADLGAGWKLLPPQPDGKPCVAAPDESDLVQTAELQPSFVWRDGVTTIGSEIDIFRTAREARRDWRLSTLAVLKACLLQSARESLGGNGVRVALSGARTLPPPPGLERALHYRFRFTVRGPQRNVVLVTDVVALGRGRITVVLHSLTVARPLPAAVLEPLARALADRLNGGRKGA